MFEAWAFRKLGVAALHAFDELFGQFPGSAAQCHQHVYPLKEGRADLIEVEGNDDCTESPIPVVTHAHVLCNRRKPGAASHLPLQVGRLGQAEGIERCDPFFVGGLDHHLDSAGRGRDH